uniref:Uncharacterized protein n=1 Tax=Romanomermis culicivorax TaxID=13658 RepID=A0A915IC96_ROMCU
MAAHFEIKEINNITKIIQSQIWVNNQNLIDLLVQKIVYHGKNRYPIPVTDEFRATILQDGSSYVLAMPKINKEN